jgi:hypothetical protein
MNGLVSFFPFLEVEDISENLGLRHNCTQKAGGCECIIRKLVFE